MLLTFIDVHLLAKATQVRAKKNFSASFPFFLSARSLIRTCLRIRTREHKHNRFSFYFLWFNVRWKDARDMTVWSERERETKNFHSLSFGGRVTESIQKFCFQFSAVQVIVKVASHIGSQLTGSSSIAIVRNEFTSTHVQSRSITIMTIRLTTTTSWMSDNTQHPFSGHPIHF